jgi:hypothetical protein
LFILFSLLLVVITPVKGYTVTNTDWSVHIKVSVPDSRAANGTVWNHLIAGTREGATDGFDSAWDTISMVETDDPVQAIFTHGTILEDSNNDGMIEKWSCSSQESGYGNSTCSLWRDIRSFGVDKVWSFIVLSTSNGGTVTLQWGFDSKPENMGIHLVELSNPSNIIDMGNSSLYSYTNTFETGKKYGIRYFEIRMKVKGLFIFPTTLPDATIGILYSNEISAVGGAPVWGIDSGGLPPGLFLNSNTGEIAGVPAAVGSYRFTVRADDTTIGYSSLREYVININPLPEINVTELPVGVVGTVYRGEILVTGGTRPMTWDIKGNLPEGITFDRKTGVTSGTLIVPGIYNFTVTVIDGSGVTDSQDFQITIMEPDDKSPPDAINDLNGFYITDSSILLMWTAPSDDSMTGTAAIYDLRYLEDCSASSKLDDSTWDNAVGVSGEPRPQSGALQTFTLTGLTGDRIKCVAIKSMDASGNISHLSNVLTTNDLTDSSRLAFVQNGSSLVLRMGYNLISLSLIPVPNERESLFGSSIGTPVSLYRWYSAYPGITPPQYYLEDTVSPGFGYLLYSPIDNARLNISGLKIEEPEYSVMLQSGWNMIGVPYTEAVLLYKIQVRSRTTGKTMPYIDAVKAGWIGNTIYNLKTGNYEFASFNDNPPAVLEPSVGYWIYVGEENGVEIIFGKP